MVFFQVVYCLLMLFPLTYSIRPQFSPEYSESVALHRVLQELGVRTELYTDLCNLPGISCQKRASSASESDRVTRIILPNRSLVGSISSSIGQFSELKELSLSNNSLSGQIPSQIANCRKLVKVHLQHNKFSGKISEEISSLINLRFLDLSFNEFSGDLSIFHKLKNLENLSISNNFLTGSSNDLWISLKKLKFLNYTENRLWQSDNSTTKRYTFKEKTSSNVSTKSASPSPSPTSSKAPKKKRKIGVYILGFFAGISGVLLSIIIVSLAFRKYVLDDTRGAIFSPTIKKEDLAFLEKEDVLSSLEMIGRTVWSEVYKAELPGNPGKLIAIKRIDQSSINATDFLDEDSKLLNKKMEQIRSEIQSYVRIKHKNLLPLLAHIIKGETHFLVSEYMKNGSLQDILNQISSGQRELPWPTRHRIALGIAAGLEYLHMKVKPRIIHGDLKPANVLLDDDMQARIADFGLARSIWDTNTRVTTTNIARTVELNAPEYRETLKFTDKSDIYSLGVLLAVLVVGKLPSDEFFQHTEEGNMMEWLKNIIRSENQKKAIDEKLLGNGFEEEMLLVLKIACFCTVDDPYYWPRSKDVYKMLSQIKPREI